MYKNFKINSANKIYQSLKEKAEGAVAIEWEIGGKSGTAYHLYTPNLVGKLYSIDLHTSDSLPGQPVSLRITLEHEADRHVLELPLLDYKGEWLSDWVVSLASVITNFEKGDNLEIFVNQNRKDKSGRLYRTLYIKKNGEFSNLNFKFTDTPKWVITEETHKVTKKVTKKINKEAHDEFIMGYINTAVEKFKSPIESSQSERNEPSIIDELEEESDLPF